MTTQPKGKTRPQSVPPTHPAPRLGECFALALSAVEALAEELEATSTGIPEHAETFEDLHQLTVAAYTVIARAESGLTRLRYVDLAPAPAPELESLESPKAPARTPEPSATPLPTAPITGNSKTYYQIPPEALEEPVYAVQVVGIHNVPYLCLRQDFSLPEKILRKVLRLQKQAEKEGIFSGLLMSESPEEDDNFFGILPLGGKWHSIRGRFTNSFETLEDSKNFVTYAVKESGGNKTDWLLLQRVGDFIIPEKF